MDMLDKGMIHVQGKMEQDGVRLHYATQNGVQFKIYELFISVIFHLIILGCCWLRVTETVESETADNGWWLYVYFKIIFLRWKKINYMGLSELMRMIIIFVTLFE